MAFSLSGAWCESTMTTRSSTKIWLIGHTIPKITGGQLPSKGDVLRVFFHIHRTVKNTAAVAASVTKEILPFWERARIPTQLPKNVTRKVLSLHGKWHALGKNRSRNRPADQAAQQAFQEELGDLFDCAASDAMAKIVIEEDRQFLIAQREKGRRGLMAGVDMKLTEMEARKAASSKAQAGRKEKATQYATEATATLELEDSDDTHSSCSSSSFPFRGVALPPPGTDAAGASTSSAPPPRKRRATRGVVSAQLASALDRTKVSNRAAVHVVSATAASLGHNPGELVLNRESIRRARLKVRKEMAEEIRMKFSPTVPLVVHWDGKIVKDEGGDKVERIAIIVSGEGVDKLLAVPRLDTGTGRAQADAVLDTLRDWDLVDRVIGLSFDTTAANSGQHNGACVLIEDALGRQLLNLACRHHMFELVADKAFMEAMGPSNGPDIAIFQRFQKQWKLIDSANFKPFTTDDAPRELLDARDELILGFKRQLNQRQPRDDYRELLELSIICLGGVPPRGIRFLKPGALHRARWMARVIYSLKIHLFREQFHASNRDKRGIERFVLFALQLYVPAWYEAPVATSAPQNDLSYMKALLRYKDQDPAISKAAATVFGRHLWYLSEHLVGLALFDENVPHEEKRRMLEAMRDKQGMEKPHNRLTMESSLSVWEGKTLADFCSTNSKKLVADLGMAGAEFLGKDPDTWSWSPSYRSCCQRAASLSVTNDRAERGVALMQEFNLALTTDEEQRQFLFQVVEQHRGENPKK